MEPMEPNNHVVINSAGEATVHRKDKEVSTGRVLFGGKCACDRKLAFNEPCEHELIYNDGKFDPALYPPSSLQPSQRKTIVSKNEYHLDKVVGGSDDGEAEDEDVPGNPFNEVVGGSDDGEAAFKAPDEDEEVPGNPFNEVVGGSDDGEAAFAAPGEGEDVPVDSGLDNWSDAGVGMVDGSDFDPGSDADARSVDGSDYDVDGSDYDPGAHDADHSMPQRTSRIRQAPLSEFLRGATELFKAVDGSNSNLAACGKLWSLVNSYRRDGSDQNHSNVSDAVIPVSAGFTGKVGRPEQKLKASAVMAANGGSQPKPRKSQKKLAASVHRATSFPTVRL